MSTAVSSNLRCPDLVGREAETAAFDRALSALVDDGRGGVLALIGNAGLGKSRLIERLTTAAEDAGVRALVGRSPRLHHSVAYAPLQAALLGAPRLPELVTRNDLEAVRPLLGHLVPLAGVEPAPEPSPLLLSHALLLTLDALEASVVVVIEDLHDADVGTLGVLEHLVTSAAQHRLLLVVTTRPEGRRAATALEMIRTAGVDALELGPLDEDDVVSLAARTFDVTSVGPTLRRLLDRADGVPLLVEDLLADARQRDALVVDADAVEATAVVDDVPARFQDVVRGQLDRLSPAAAQLVRAVAVLGATVELGILPDATGLDADDLVAATDEARRAQLLGDDGVSFRHSLTADAVLASTTLVERQVLARRVRDALGDVPRRLLPAAAEVLAFAGEVDRAAATLRTAAANDVDSGVLEAAIEHLTRARELVNDADLAVDLLVDLVRNLADVGRFDDAQRLADSATNFVPPDRRIDLHFPVATKGLLSNRPEAQRHLDIIEADLTDDDPRMALALVTRARSLGYLAEPGRSEAEVLSRRAAEIARAADDAEALGEATIFIAMCRIADPDPTEFRTHIDETLRIADAAGLRALRRRALHILAVDDLFQRGEVDSHHLLREETRRVGALLEFLNVSSTVAVGHLLRGEADECRRIAGEAIELAVRLGQDGATLACRCWAACALGLDDRAAGLAALDELDAMPQVYFQGPYQPHTTALAGRGVLGVLDDDLEPMRAAVKRARADGLSDDDLHASWLLMMEAFDRQVTDPTRIETALAERFEFHFGFGRLIGTHALAMVIGPTDDERATELVDSVAPLVDGFPLYALVSLRVLGEAALRDGWGRPVEWLRQAEAVARRLDQRPLVKGLQALQRQAGASVPRDRRVDETVPAHLRRLGVTAREHEVLERLESRPTNAELAEALHISVRTVEKHVASLISKLAAADRHDVPARAEALARG